ncbi:MarR family transcriptional regulator [bacterium]|nr:MAG: MarR family transcriptional regulator [bacterium]
MTTKLNEKKFSIDESIGYLTSVAYRAINRKLSDNLRVAGNKITSEQYGVLKQLWLEEGQTQLDLACKTSKDKPSITRLLNNLERKGLIERKVNDNDKRCNKIYLTSKGESLKTLCLSIANQTVDEATKSIKKSDLNVCKKVLANICDNLINKKD